MRVDILKQIVKIANELDRKGYYKEADELDKIAMFSGFKDGELEELIDSPAERLHEAEQIDEQREAERLDNEESEAETTNEEEDVLDGLDNEFDNLFDVHLEKLKENPEVITELNEFIDSIYKKLELPHDSDVPFADDGFGKTAAKKKKKPVAKNKKLWARAIAAAKKKFDVYPSRYANHWASNWYEEKGGEWE